VGPVIPRLRAEAGEGSSKQGSKFLVDPAPKNALTDGTASTLEDEDLDLAVRSPLAILREATVEHSSGFERLLGLSTGCRASGHVDRLGAVGDLGVGIGTEVVRFARSGFPPRNQESAVVVPLIEVRALVPTAEIGDYAIGLRSMTGGAGVFTRSHHGYQVVPDTVASS
jgi:hypothetical protein